MELLRKQIYVLVPAARFLVGRLALLITRHQVRCRLLNVASV
jgi:hypothetical protein